jgi:hypothetical protein
MILSLKAIVSLVITKMVLSLKDKIGDLCHSFLYLGG